MGYVSLGSRGVSGYRPVGMAGLSRALGLGSLPGFVDYYPGGQGRSDSPSDPAAVLSAISEGIYDVVSQFLYIMGADAFGADTCDTCRAGRQAIETYFTNLVTPADVTNGSASKINAAANATAKYFINLFGGKARGATGIPSSDLAGNCNAYILGPTAPLWRSQIQNSVVWSKATRCAQLNALVNGSGLDFLQVALGGDGMGGGMPTPPPLQAASTGLPDFSAAPAPGYGVLAPPPATDANGNVIGSAAAPINQIPIAGVVVSNDPVATPNVPVYNPPPVATPTTPAAVAAALQQQQQPAAQNTYNSYFSYPASASGSAAAPAVASSSTVGGITDWISSNPLLAAGLVAGALFMFSQGGRR